MRGLVALGVWSLGALACSSHDPLTHAAPDAAPTEHDGGRADTGSDSSAPADASEPEPDAGKLVVPPDTSTTKITDCTSASDMTLCEVATTPDRWYDVCVNGICVSPGCGEPSCNTSGPHFRMPPMHGHTQFAVLAGDQPVSIDLVTGLHWTACAAGMSGADCTQGMPTEMNFEAALAYCDTLDWAGHDDWYLPDAFEAISLVDFDTGASGLISPTAFPNQAAVSALYWTTTFVDNHEQLFSTGQDQDGFSSLLRKHVGAVGHSVLCVRRGFSEPMPELARFSRIIGAQPWVRDHTTGLIAQGCVSDAVTCDGTGFTQTAAAAHCAHLFWGEARANNWRLPSYKEALALFEPFDLALSQPGLDPELFGELSGRYVLVDDASLLDILNGSRVGIGSPDKLYPVLCVRVR